MAGNWQLVVIVNWTEAKVASMMQKLQLVSSRKDTLRNSV